MILQHFGLAKPYRFERTLVAIAAVILFFIIGACAAYLYVRGQLAAGSPRSWYFVYVAGLAVLAIALTRVPALAAVALVVVTLELGLGVGSLLLYKFGGVASPSLAPLNEVVPPVRFAWHPLLQALPLPTNGRPAPVQINSERQRGKEHSAEDLKGKIVVALFGGSTTIDGAQPDGLSWPDRLQAILGDRYVVVNHGMGGYTTAEHAVQTLFYERTKGVSPTCSVYYVGWNDVRNAHIRDLDPGYADFHLPNQIDGFRARETDIYRSISPLATLLGRLAGSAFDTLRPAQPAGAVSADPDPALESIFARNVAAISAINRQRSIRTIWVGQLMNRPLMTSDQSSWWVPLVPERDVVPLIDRLNAITKREAKTLGDVYVSLPVDRFETGGFRDHGHFTQAGSLLFATLLAPTIAANCGKGSGQ